MGKSLVSNKNMQFLAMLAIVAVAVFWLGQQSGILPASIVGGSQVGRTTTVGACDADNLATISVQAYKDMLAVDGTQTTASGTAELYLDGQSTKYDTGTLVGGNYTFTNKVQCGSKYFIVIKSEGAVYATKTQVKTASGSLNIEEMQVPSLSAVQVRFDNATTLGSANGRTIFTSGQNTDLNIKLKATSSQAHYGAEGKRIIALGFNPATWSQSGLEVRSDSGFPVSLVSCPTVVATALPSNTTVCYEVSGDLANGAEEVHNILLTNATPVTSANQIYVAVKDNSCYTLQKNGIVFCGYQNADTGASVGASISTATITPNQ